MNIHNLVFTVVIFTVTTLTAADFASVKSPALRGGDKPLTLTLDVKGVERLRLSATGYSWGQAAWCEPVLTAVDGSIVKLSDLKPVSKKVGWGEFMVNKGPDNKPLKVGGREFVHGLFAHADSIIEYDIGGKFTRFDVWVGVNATAETGLAWCRGGKASKVAIPLVTKRQQPPDVFRVQSHTKPEEEGEPVITFAGSDNTSYQAMLKIIKEALMAALKKPRVDMPGADIIKGKCRELVPISPPVVAEK